MEGGAGRCWCVDPAGLDRASGTPGSGRRVLLTDVTAGSGSGGMTGRAQACSTCLCHSGWRPGQGWPSPGVGNSCFGLCWWRGRCSVGKKGKGYITENQSGHKSSSLSPFYHEQWREERGGEKGCADSGGRVF